MLFLKINFNFNDKRRGVLNLNKKHRILYIINQ